jgi:hypothetical protein
MIKIDRVLAMGVSVLLASAGAPAFAQLVQPAQNPPASNPAAPATTPAQPDASPATGAQPVTGAGRLVFVNDTAETGDILDLAPAEVRFEFRNVGPGPLTITRVQSSCGCTVPELDKKVYEPNEFGVITAKFDPKGLQGNISRSIQVFTDSNTTPSVSINVRSYVKPVVVVMPKDILNFEMVEKGQGAVKEVRVFGRIPDFEVTRASTDDPLMYDVEIEKKGEADVMGEMLPEFVVRVKLKDNAPPGQHTGSLTIRTNDERRAIFSVGLLSRVLGDLEMSPVRMTLGRLALGDAFEREIRVRSRSGKPFEISGVALSNQSVAVEFEFEPVDPEVKTEWIVRAKGTVRSAAPRFNAMVNIITDVPSEELTPFYMTGVLRP